MSDPSNDDLDLRASAALDAQLAAAGEKPVAPPDEATAARVAAMAAARAALRDPRDAPAPRQLDAIVRAAVVAAGEPAGTDAANEAAPETVPGLPRLADRRDARRSAAPRWLGAAAAVVVVVAGLGLWRAQQGGDGPESAVTDQAASTGKVESTTAAGPEFKAASSTTAPTNAGAARDAAGSTGSTASSESESESTSASAHAVTPDGTAEGAQAGPAGRLGSSVRAGAALIARAGG